MFVPCLLVQRQVLGLTATSSGRQSHAASGTIFSPGLKRAGVVSQTASQNLPGFWTLRFPTTTPGLRSWTRLKRRSPRETLHYLLNTSSSTADEGFFGHRQTRWISQRLVRSTYRTTDCRIHHHNKQGYRFARTPSGRVMLFKTLSAISHYVPGPIFKVCVRFCGCKCILRL